jgi:hypothetical protein
MSKDPINRTIIADRSILHNLKCLLTLNVNSNYIQQFSAAVLNDISTDLQGAFVIQFGGLAGPIQALIHHKIVHVGKSLKREHSTKTYNIKFRHYM